MKILSCVLLLLAALAAPARAAVPHEMTFTARLVNGDTPYEGDVALTFDLYTSATGGTSLWSESTTANATLGLVAARLGATTPLDLAVIDGGDLYLQVTVESTVLSPRLAIGSVPYAVRAAYADDCGAVPTGSVMFFDLDACPAGWSPLDAARGRAIVGLPTGGTLGGTVGAALGDLENRTHTHTVDPAAATTSTTGAHTHTVDPAQVTSSAVDLAHTHTVDPAAFNISGGSHNHAWSVWNQALLTWTSYSSTGAPIDLVDFDDGIGNEGVGNYPVEDTQGASRTLYTANDASHVHTVDVPSTQSGDASVSMNHAHTVNVGVTTSSTSGDHAHTVDVASTTSSATAAGMPYLQLLACRRD